MKNIVFRDDQFASQTLRLLSAATSGMADIGEILTTAEKITEAEVQGVDRDGKKASRCCGRLC
ncbi:hypothetical protein ACJDU8_21710 [Clostridium sp. WILCCON 0269]|uniref:Uncharacterized protein n=1 Tax=Candidatus Clostridium eludens TaxID=3381663 RepID=A0ABW8SSI2_9CLOT